MHRHPLAAVLLSGFAALLLTACSGGNVNGSASSNGTPAVQALSGSVHGGQSPVTGTTVTLYAAGIGAAATQLGSAAVTDASGSWSIADFTCPAGNPETYLVASSGNPGLAPGTDNTALQMMAALGVCNSLPAAVNVNEITTVAAAYALNGFISTSNPDDIQSSASNATGLTNAFTTAANLADAATGSDGPALTDTNNSTTEQKFNSLANSLAACVNTAGGTSSQCVELFACALPGASFSAGNCTGGSGTTPTDTLQAALSIARNAGQVSMAGVYDVATRNAVFDPALAAAPNDETLALDHTGGGLNGSTDGYIAIDAGGNVWTTSNANSTVNEFDPSGNALSPSFGYAHSALGGPEGIAIDATGRVWVASFSGHLNELHFNGGTLTVSSPYTGGGLDGPIGVAIDGSGNVWASSYSNNTVNEFDSAGHVLSPSTGDTGGGLSKPYGIATDAAGNVWVASYGNNDVSKFDSSGGALSPGTGYTNKGLNSPFGIAIDAGGHAWIPSYSSTLVELDADGSSLSPSTGYTGGGINIPQGVAIDAGGNVWTASFNNNSINEFNSAGTALSPSINGYVGGGLIHPRTIAVDASGNVWVVNKGINLTELVGAASPTRTPLVAAITQGFAP